MNRGERSVRRGGGYGDVGGWQSLVWYVVSYTHAYDASRHIVGDLVTMSQGKTLGTPEGFYTPLLGIFCVCRGKSQPAGPAEE